MTEAQLLRMKAVVLAREAGMSFVWIGKRHGVSRQRAWQIYSEATWPTDVMQQKRLENGILSIVDRYVRAK